MITLKESILSRSSHGAKGFEAQRRIETIKEWLKEYNIKNYTINDDFTIDVDGNVNLGLKDLSEFPDYIQFRVVKGNFYCFENNLTSLRGCPRKVGRIFDCSYNQLTSLEGAPKEVRINFYCLSDKTQFTEEDVKKVCNVNGKIYTK